MITLQEELDWEVYRLYGILGDDLTAEPGDVPQLNLGERAFEIVLARKVAAGEEQTAWFARHRSTPITGIPTHWPAAYQHLVERRIRTIEEHPLLHLVERPECKRRWASRTWEEMQADALRGWVLDLLVGKASMAMLTPPAPTALPLGGPEPKETPAPAAMTA